MHGDDSRFPGIPPDESGGDDSAPMNAVAIIGIGVRLPGADDVDAFWRNLRDGVESITTFTDAELEDSFDAETRAAPNFVKSRPILRNIDQFDAEFFGMYAKEAELTDPQHRVLLECAWEALENAGYDPSRYAGAIGAYAGSSINTYFIKHVLRDRAAVDRFTSDYQVASYPALLGAGHDFTASRIAYKLDLRGPAVNLNSACSTSLLAVAQACQSLLLYQSDMALAGGASISLPQQRGYLYLEGGMASSDGHCRSFDAGATGTVFGSGAGMVLLKRLDDAIADGDHVYAVIRGCGVNNDGAGKVGFTAPSVEGQAGCIEMAHAVSGVDARTISYVECHGTATPLGDPIEVAGLTRAFRVMTNDTQFCWLGSAKSNVGHLDAAAGVTGLVKTALALKHRQLPATLHYRAPNPQIDFATTPFRVNAELRHWDSVGPRRAGVSAFGVGGTNVHAVLEEAPAAACEPLGDVGHAGQPQLLLLSARNEAALAVMKTQLAARLREPAAPGLAEVAYTLQTGRRGFDHRWAFVASDRDEAIAALEGRSERSATTATKAAQAPAVVFMFPGQGAQYPDMGRGLYEAEPVFREAVDRCADLLAPLLGRDLRELLYPIDDREAAAATLMSTISAQPAIFTIEYALAQLWLSWGVQPVAMIGHSIGEFVAATLAGVFALEDALRLVAARGQLMQALPGGAMLAVRLPEAEVLPLLNSELAIAAINGPALCVVSGPYAAVEALEKTLAERSVGCRRLHTSHAFHSPMVEPIVAPLRVHAAATQLAAPSIPLISCVTGTWLTEAQAQSPDYWARHAREPVRFVDGINTVTHEATPLLLELGPGNVLTTLALQITRGRGLTVIGSLPDAARETGDYDCALSALGRLWLAGLEPDWLAVHRGQRRRVPLPTYPFQRSRHWLDAPEAQISTPRAAALSAAAAPTVSAPLTAAPVTIAATAAPAPSPPPAMTQDDHVAALRATIIAILEDLSGETPPTDDPNATFLEMGFDSLFLTQVTQRIQSQLKVKITFRQLLGDYATIPALAAFLAEKTPRPTAPPPAAPVAAPTVVAPMPAAAPVAMPALAASGAPGLEGLFRDQLATMSQLIQSQLAALQTLGGGAQPAPVAVVAAPAPVAPVAATNAPAPAATSEAEADFQRPSRFNVYKPGAKAADTTVTPEQTAHIAQLIARYAAKMPGSKQKTQDYRAVLADPRAASGFRAEWKEMVFPIICARSKGSKIWDVDGNEFVDLVNGYGQTAFGHTPDFVADAVHAQLDRGFAIGPQADLAGEVAALFAELTGNERVTFCNTGSEAVMAAMRVARNITGRMKVAVFNGAYHGQFDEVLVKGVQRPGAKPRSKPVANGIPDESVANMVVLDYGTPESLQWIRDNAEDLAAVVVETVQSRHPNLYPIEFLRELRKITEASGTAFVMDEVVTGFRVHPGGMQHVSGIRADMATYGKVVGGGLPIGILAGNRRFMDGLDGGIWQYGDDSFPEVGVTFFAGTFVRHPLVLAAVKAVLEHIKREGPQLQENLAKRTTALVAELNAVFQSHGLQTRIETFSSWFYFNFHNEHPLAPLFFYHLRERGVHIQDGFPCFLTTAHSDDDLRKIVHAFRDSLAELQSVGILAPANRATADAAPATAMTAPLNGVPLTEPQVEIWLAAQRGDEASCAFNESVTLRLNGTLDPAALQYALDQVVARHDALRASFGSTGESMTIAMPAPMALSRAEAADETAFAALVLADACTPFDLVNGPLIRAQLVRFTDDRHALIVTAHHIICDGWSINVIVNELAELYAARCRGAVAELPTALPFSRYAVNERRQDADEAARTEAFWLGQYAEPVAPLDLPTDRPRPALRSYNGASRCKRINAEVYQAVKKSGARLGSTLFATLLAAFEALAGRLGGQNEVVIAVPTAGQSLLEDEILVGHCVNFLPIRNRWQPQTTVAEHLANVAKSVLEAFEHQRYTFGTLVRQLGLKREMNRLPLTELQFNLERLADMIELPGLKVAVEPNAKAYVNFDLFLNIIESADGLRMDCDYNTDLYDAETVDRWLDCYQALLEAFVADARQPLVAANLLPTPLRNALITAYNDTARDYPTQRCVHQLFEAQAALHPERIAAEFGHATLSYAALERRSNQVAQLLLQRCGANAKPVGVLVDRSLDLLATLLAVMKTGRAYIPLDPTHPAARIRQILGEAEVSALVTDDVSALALVPADVAKIHLANDAIELARMPVAAPTIAVDPSAAAYLIYTSGSTGVPKGVEVSHRAVVNLLTSMAREPGLKADDILFAVTTVSFDIAALELYLPLTVGARVVIAETEEVADGFKLVEHLRDSRSTVLQATPATWRLLLEAEFKPAPGFKMLCGGEALPRDLANRLLALGDVELWNMYGPTETTIWSSCQRVSAGEGPITIGKPIANTQFYILDSADQLLPPGVPGQLHIGGDGVAIGYYQRPELNADRFIANPFSSGRIYRTGDLARWLPDGTIQHLGRMDHQTKLRGFRIELGEIETALISSGGVASAVVVVREDTPGAPKLTAYYVERPDAPRAPAQLRAALIERLPDYMVPAAWQKLDTLPLTPNGKVDRKALPAADTAPLTEADYTAPSTPTETTLAKIWAEVLRMERIGVLDDLFTLGTDSIQLFQIAARAKREQLSVTAKMLVQLRTIAAIAKALDAPPADNAANEVPVNEGLPSLKQFQRRRP